MRPHPVASPDPADLIADTGHPEFPGWEFVAILLMAATISALLSPNIELLLRRRLPSARTGVVRLIEPNAVRLDARRAA